MTPFKRNPRRIRGLRNRTLEQVRVQTEALTELPISELKNLRVTANRKRVEFEAMGDPRAKDCVIFVGMIDRALTVVRWKPARIGKFGRVR